MLYLKQSTASQSVLLGPFVDDTDGATAETGLTIANTDIRLSSNGGNMFSKTSGGGTHDENGYYTITFDATDTATVGRLQVSSKVAGALAVFIEFNVLEESIYDSLIAASASGFDSNQRIDVGRVLGTAQTANDHGADLNTLVTQVGTAGDGLTNINLPNQTMDIVGDITGNISGSVGSVTGHTPQTGDNFNRIGIGGAGLTHLAIASINTEARLSELDSGNIPADLDTLLTRIANTLNTTALGNIGVDWANVENPSTVLDLSATDIQLVDTVTTYTGDTPQTADHTANIALILTDTGTTLENHLTDIKGTGFVKDTHSLTDIEGFVDLIDDVTDGLTKIASDARLILSGVAGISGSTMRGTDSAALASNYTSARAGFIDNINGHTAQTGDNFTRLGIGGVGLTDLTTDLTSILSDTGELQTDWTDGGRLDAILDSVLALLDDPRSEPSQGALPVNPDSMTKLDYIYKFARNKIETTSSTISIYDDAGSTIDHKSTISDAGLTFTRGEFITGA